MKLLRALLVGVAVFTAVLLLAAVVAFNSRVQTWAARRVLASQPDIAGNVGRLDVGLNRIEIEAVHVSRPGMVFTAPAMTVDVSVLSAAVKNVAVRRVVAKGWVLQLLPSAAPVATATTTSAEKTATPQPLAAIGLAQVQSALAAPPPSTAQVFEGVFKALRLPVDFSLGEAEIEGVILLPAANGQDPGRVQVRLVGGQVGVGRPGRFELTSVAQIAGPQAPVSQVDTQSTISVQMDTPRTFQRIAVAADVKTLGAQFPQGALLHANLDLSSSAQGESYLAVVQTPASGATRKNLLDVNAAMSAGANTLSGRWRVDANSGDLTPFALGRPLPVFSALGEGNFEVGRTFEAIHTAGRFEATIEQLAAVKPELAQVGLVRTQIDFDLSKQADQIRVERFSAGASGERPIFSVQALQRFEYNLQSGALNVANPSGELMRLSLHGIPMAWIQPFLGGLALTGDDLRGEFFVNARAGGVVVRPTAPLTLTNLSLSRDGQPLLRALDVMIRASADYTTQGWQAEVAEGSVRSGATTLVTFSAKAGMAGGAAEPIKATGRYDASIPALMAQPIAADYAVLKTGRASGEFAAALDTTQQISASVTFADLVAVSGEALPRFIINSRADIAQDGQIAAQIPIRAEAAGRVSDLELNARITPGADTTGIDAQLVGETIYLDDIKPLQVLAAGLPQQRPAPSGAPAPKSSKPSGPATTPPVGSPDEVPFWNGYTGQLKLAIKELVYSPQLKITAIGGTVRIAPGALELDGVHAGLGPESEAKLAGRMDFAADRPERYSFSGDAQVSNFDPGPFLRAASPDREPAVEGHFDVNAKLVGAAPSAALLAEKIKADVTLASRSGVFRGLALPRSFAERFQGKSSNLIENLGSVVGAVVGGKTGDIAQFAVELVSLLQAVPFDQLNLRLSHDGGAYLTTIQDFTLISPTIRLTGSGSIHQQKGLSFLRQPLSAQLEMAAHGRVAELFAKYGLLRGGTDTLGYAPLFAPIKLDGTLANIGTDALRDMLVQRLLTNPANNPFGNLFGK